MKDTTGMPDSTETVASGNPRAAAGRSGPTWREWVLSIIVAVILSVTATLLLGGSGSFWPGRAAGGGAGSSCCSPADAGK